MNNSYPYPVLGHDDDVGESSFRISNSRGPLLGDQLIEMELVLETMNPTITELVKEKKALYVIEINCKQTYFKLIETSHSEVFKIAIRSSELRGRVSVRAWIVSSDNITRYAPEGMHPDYGSSTFDITTGDILAEEPGFWFIADKDFDALRSPAASFILIGNSQNEAGPMFVDWGNDGNKIIITLNKTDFENYKEIAQDPDARRILHGSIVLPVLVQGVVAVREGNSSDYYNSRLDAAIQSKIQSGKIKNFSTEQPIVIAQEVLDLPIGRSLQGARELMSRGDYDIEE